MAFRARPARPHAPAASAPGRAAPADGSLAGGVVWIVVVAALLAGVVAVNVAVLRLNLGLDGAQPASRRSSGQTSRPTQAKLASTKRTRTIVQRRLGGLVPADPATTQHRHARA